MRILIVEDSELIRKVTRLALQALLWAPLAMHPCELDPPAPRV
jgi:hypothetical protein